MPSQNTRKKRRLHRENPRCHWCGTLTVLSAPRQAPEPRNLATVDHVISVREWRRLEESGQAPSGPREVVLACRSCNQRRNDAENLQYGNGERVPRADWISYDTLDLAPFEKETTLTEAAK